MEERKGYLTPQQEKKLDGVVKLSGLAEKLDGPAIQLADNQGLERLKGIMNEKYPGANEIVYQIIDVIFEQIPEPAEE